MGSLTKTPAQLSVSENEAKRNMLYRYFPGYEQVGHWHRMNYRCLVVH